MSILRYHRWRLLTGLAVLAVLQRLAPWGRAEEPQWFKLNGIPEVSTGLEIDGSTEGYSVNGTSSSYDTLFVTPTIGLHTTGSIYHPNLLAFDVSGEGGYGWEDMRSTGPGYNQAVNEEQWLGRYLAQLNILEAKPYNASLYAAKDQTYRDYGSFETFKVDSERYGGRVSWNQKNLNLNVDFGYRDETDSGLVNSSEVQETFVNFLGIHKRQSGQTSVTARWDMFDNILNIGSLLTMNESVGIADSETFGNRKQITAATGVSFSHAEYSSQKTDTVNATEHININHTRSLDSYLLFDFAHDTLRSAEDNRAQGTYGLRHQLYESLTSTLDGHGNYQQSTSAGASSTVDRFGAGLYENYVKRLQSWGRLSLGGGIAVDHEDDTSTGGIFTTVNEQHQLFIFGTPSYRPVYLNRPAVLLGSVQVTANGVGLVAGTDYQVIASGELAEMRLLSSATVLALANGNQSLSVLVTYESQPQNASYEALNSTAQLRLDLPAGFGVYGRMNWLDNNAPPQVLTQTLMDLVGGMDYHWRWFRTGAECEDYDSNFTKYQALRFFQSFDFALNRRSTLSVGFSETFYHYQQNGDQKQYQMLARYSIQLWSSLSLYVQGGCSLQDVLGTEQTQGAAQTGLTWSRGKLSVRAGYEYNEQSTANGPFTDDREKHRLFLYLKRTF
ncbi:MAG TPA: hypothetical protein VF988_11985 [Verrucomicrobiae bacterium]